jgi:CspA family cold shock protein
MKFNGQVAWFNPKRGYGFIVWEKDNVVQKDLFVHFSDIESEGFKTLHKNQKVAFSLGTNKHGVLKATDVVLIS